MILRLFRRTPRSDTIASLYGTIVAQARAPAFYQIYGVPDTANGRLEMIILHSVLLLRRLGAEQQRGAAAGPAVGQAIFDLFCRDMDANLREMGVGDQTVPRAMRQIGEAFYGRQAAYESALAAADAALVDALARNVFAPQRALGAPRLAVYVREAVRHLAAQDGAAIGRGELTFPDPAGVEAAAGGAGT